MNSSIKGKSVHFDEQYLHVELSDKRIISTPMEWYPELQNASMCQIKNYRFICKATGIEWPDIDYHLSIVSMFAVTQREKAA
jgi:hypothetical protein